MDQSQAINNSIEPNDKHSRTKTMYDVSPFEVFGRNFLAGLGRSMGSIGIYLVFLFIFYSLFVDYVLPHIQPFIVEYRQAIESITKLNSTTGPGAGQDNNQYQQFLQNLNSSLPIKE